MREKLEAVFKANFKSLPDIIVCSPGRINLIGEHTDYNGGFVLPAAIDKFVYFSIAKNNTNNIQVFAESFNDFATCEIENVIPQEKTWVNYVLGVVKEFQKAGYIISGFNASIYSTVPMGAGVSSSAALECATAFALNHVFNLQIDTITLVKMAQQAEHNFAGVKCGIMDQFASMMGKANHCILLDCNDISYDYIPLHLDGYKIVLINSNVKHSLAESAYNARRQACEQAVAWLNEAGRNISFLREATEQMLKEIVLPKSKIVFDKALFVVQEIKRTQEACDMLQQNNIIGLGKHMFNTHEGLSKLYEVSCQELDFLVSHAKQNNSVVGARLMGGGFGGCTINIVKENEVPNFIDEITVAYENNMHKKPTAYIINTADGTALLN
jgi:galactokinase